MLRGNTFIGIQTSSLHWSIRYETTRELLLLADPYFLNPGIRQILYTSYRAKYFHISRQRATLEGSAKPSITANDFIMLTTPPLYLFSSNSTWTNRTEHSTLCLHRKHLEKNTHATIGSELRLCTSMPALYKIKLPSNWTLQDPKFNTHSANDLPLKNTAMGDTYSLILLNVSALSNRL